MMTKPENYFGFLNGAARMASCVSVRCGPSEIRCDCYSPKSFAPLFCKDYRVKPALLQLRDSGKSLPARLRDWLGDEPKDVVDGLCYLIHSQLDDEVQVLDPENIEALAEALSMPGGHGPFYTTEDLFFAVFRNVAVCFMLGNYE